MLAKLLYNLSIRAYLLGIWLAAFFYPKAKKWLKGRENWVEKLEKSIAALPQGHSRIWVHCASLGEFEQGRPVIEALAKEYSKLQIIVSFFSPSGFEIRQNYALASHVCYLPADTPANARKFIKILQPDLAIFVKYEFWYHYLAQLKKQNIPTLLISAIFRPDQLFFKQYGGFYRKMLHFFDHIFVQNQASARLLDGIGSQQYSFGGDTRVDRVADIAAAPNAYLKIEQFLANTNDVLIAGSTWPPDEAILCPFVNNTLPKNWKVIIAPHETGPSAIQRLQKSLTQANILYSEASDKTSKDYQVMIIDNVGMLAHLYRYGKLAYIGGGFGAGIHNTLEPIAFGLPLFFGPRYKKFEEAQYLVKNEAAIAVEQSNDLARGFNLWLDHSSYTKASKTAKLYINNNQGASKKITDYIGKNISISQ